MDPPYWEVSLGTPWALLENDHLNSPCDKRLHVLKPELCMVKVDVQIIFGQLGVYGARRHLRGVGVCSLLRQLLLRLERVAAALYIAWPPRRRNHRWEHTLESHPSVSLPPHLKLSISNSLPVWPMLASDKRIFMESLCSICGSELRVCVCVQGRTVRVVGSSGLGGAGPS